MARSSLAYRGPVTKWHSESLLTVPASALRTTYRTMKTPQSLHWSFLTARGVSPETRRANLGGLCRPAKVQESGLDRRPLSISMALQFPFTHITPGLQSVSNTQARAGLEVRQRTVTMAMPRIVDALFGSPP